MLPARKFICVIFGFAALMLCEACVFAQSSEQGGQPVYKAENMPSHPLKTLHYWQWADRKIRCVDFKKYYPMDWHDRSDLADRHSGQSLHFWPYTLAEYKRITAEDKSKELLAIQCVTDFSTLSKEKESEFIDSLKGLGYSQIFIHSNSDQVARSTLLTIETDSRLGQRAPGAGERVDIRKAVKCLGASKSEIESQFPLPLRKSMGGYEFYVLGNARSKDYVLLCKAHRGFLYSLKVVKPDYSLFSDKNPAAVITLWSDVDSGDKPEESFRMPSPWIGLRLSQIGFVAAEQQRE